MYIINRLKDFIANNYSTFKEFSEKTNIDYSTLSKYLNNKVKPSIEILKKLYDAGVSLNYLASGKGDQYSDSLMGNVLRGWNKINSDVINTHEVVQRINSWIILNYDSIENFQYIMNTCEEEKTTNKIEIIEPSPDLLEQLNNAGCNIEWILTGRKSEYADNSSGTLLKLKKHGISFNGHTLKTNDNTINKDEIYKLILEIIHKNRE